MSDQRTLDAKATTASASRQTGFFSAREHFEKCTFASRSRLDPADGNHNKHRHRHMSGRTHHDDAGSSVPPADSQAVNLEENLASSSLERLGTWQSAMCARNRTDALDVPGGGGIP